MRLLPDLYSRRIIEDLRRENAALRDTVHTLQVALAAKTEQLHRMTLTLNEITANEAAGADAVDRGNVVSFIEGFSRRCR